MILHQCKTCKEERFENHFVIATTATGEKCVTTKRCKLCQGKAKRIRNRENEKYDVNFNKMMLVLTRLHFNDGQATDADCLVISETYRDLYGDIPDSRMKDKLSYQWNRLRRFWNRNNEFKF